MKTVNNQAVIFKLLKTKTKNKKTKNNPPQKNPKDLKFIYTALQRKMAFKLPS